VQATPIKTDDAEEFSESLSVRQFQESAKEIGLTELHPTLRLLKILQS